MKQRLAITRQKKQHRLKEQYLLEIQWIKEVKRLEELWLKEIKRQKEQQRIKEIKRQKEQQWIKEIKQQKEQQRIKEIKQQKEQQRIKEQNRINNKKTLEYIRNNTTQCPGCRISTVKIDGCNHMTCICGAEFCWGCKSEYSDCLCNK